jgi:hypothetical protein
MSEAENFSLENVITGAPDVDNAEMIFSRNAGTEGSENTVTVAPSINSVVLFNNGKNEVV